MRNSGNCSKKASPKSIPKKHPQKRHSMKIVIIGSGGAGGYFGAKLAKAGEEVTFVARGAHLQAMQASGLTIQSAVEGEWQVKANAVENLAGHAIADIVLICVKSYDTEAAAELAKPVIGPHTGVLSLQNGLDNEDKIGRVLGRQHIIGGVCYVFSNIVAPGVIAHHQLGRIVMGEMDGQPSEQPSERTQAFLAACQRAAIPAEIAPNIRKALWEKFVFLAALAGTTALTRLPIKFIREIPETGRLWELQVDELLAIAKADGVALDDDMKARCVKLLESVAPTNYSSLYHDLIQGKRMELDALHGYATQLGQRLGVPCPTLFAVYAALRPYVQGTPDLNR
jgi:2-dehydropantoate 2-reductase